MNKRQKREKEMMMKYGGVIFNVRMMDQDSKMVLGCDEEGYESNQYDFNVDHPQAVLYLQECEKALSDVDMLSKPIKLPDGYALLFGMGQQSEPLIDRLRKAIAQTRSVMKDQIEKHHSIYLGGFSDRMAHFLSSEGEDVGRHINKTIGPKLF